jgi:NADH:ubiquinone oxidoreductase subunit 6 (subunit J)
MSPKKPNSANRRIAKVNATSLKQNMAIKIPGEGHSLQQHSIVLVKKGKVRDLNGVSSIAIRGKYDLSGVANRKNSRSRYGTKVAT